VGAAAGCKDRLLTSNATPTGNLSSGNAHY
jgi:hypothetical protein